MAKITVELEDGSVTRVYEEESILNGHVDVQSEVESMVDTIINSVTNFL